MTDYICSFTYFFTNTFIGLFIAELFDVLLTFFLKENVTHFLGISLGINRLKLPLGELSDNNIKEISKPAEENIILKSSREPSPSRESVSSSGSSSSASSHRSLGPYSRRTRSPMLFSRDASPAPISRGVSPAPSFGSDEFDPRTEPGYHPGSPVNPSEIRPDYFRQDFASPRPPVV
jgi:hypothetical protein